MEKKEIDVLVEKYSKHITNEIKELNSGGRLVKFNFWKSKVLNAEFEDEKLELQKKIETGVITFRNKVIRKNEASKRNSTYNLKVDPIFLENLHFYNEYKRLLNEEFLNNTSDEKNKNIDQKSKYKYLEIGSLFAQNLLHRKKNKGVFIFFYNNIEFENPSQLDKYLKKEILKNPETSTIQYLRDTFSESTTKGSKNIYNSKGMMKNILDYCNDKQIEVSLNFKKKYEAFT